MGAWEVTIFGNDTACDWIYSLEKSNDLSFINKTLDAVLDIGNEFLDSPEGEEGLAACETVSRLLGKGGESDSYTEDLDKWVTAHPITPDSTLIEKAKSVIVRVQTEPSELYSLMEESDLLEDWKSVLEDLHKRLS